MTKAGPRLIYWITANIVGVVSFLYFLAFTWGWKNDVKWLGWGGEFGMSMMAAPIFAAFVITNLIWLVVLLRGPNRSRLAITMWCLTVVIWCAAIYYHRVRVVALSEMERGDTAVSEQKAK